MANPTWSFPSWAADSQPVPMLLGDEHSGSPAAVALDNDTIFMAWRGMGTTDTPNIENRIYYSFCTGLSNANETAPVWTPAVQVKNSNNTVTTNASPAVAMYQVGDQKNILLVWADSRGTADPEFWWSLGVIVVTRGTYSISSWSGGEGSQHCYNGYVASGQPPSLASSLDVDGNPGLPITMAWLGNGNSTVYTGTYTVLELGSSPVWTTQTAAGPTGGTPFSSASAPSITSLPSNLNLGTLMLAWPDSTNNKNISTSCYSATTGWSQAIQTHFDTQGSQSACLTAGRQHPILAFADNNQNIATSMYVEIGNSGVEPNLTPTYGWLAQTQTRIINSVALRKSDTPIPVTNSGTIGSADMPVVVSMPGSDELFMAVHPTWQKIVENGVVVVQGAFLYSTGKQYPAEAIWVSITGVGNTVAVSYSHRPPQGGWITDPICDLKAKYHIPKFFVFQLDSSSAGAGWKITGFTQNPPVPKKKKSSATPLAVVFAQDDKSCVVYDAAIEIASKKIGASEDFSFYFTFTQSPSPGAVGGPTVIHDDPGVQNE